MERPRSHDSAPLPEIQEARKRLRDLEMLGYELNQLQMEIPIRDRKDDSSARTDEKQVSNLEKMRRIDSIKEFVRQQMPFLRGALMDKVLLKDALNACHELIATVHFGRHIAERFADTALEMQKRLEEHVPETLLILQLMSEAHEIDDEQTRSKQKIRRAISAAGPALAVYFSEANPPEVGEMKERLRALKSILEIRAQGQSAWALNALGRHIALAVMLPQYRPRVTHASIMETLSSARPHPGDENDESDTITQFDIESILSGMSAPTRPYVLQKALEHFGLPGNMYSELAPPAMQIGRNMFMPSPKQAITLDLFSTIRTLESRRPGSVKELYARFGIRWMNRYPVDDLVSQYDERNDDSKPYGIFLSAATDWTLAFHSDTDKDMTASVAKQLRPLGHNIRFVECSDRREMMRIFSQMKSTYAANRASFLFLRAHASRQHLELGANAMYGDIKASDLEQQEFAEALQIFVEEPSIIFDGCSIGRKGGLAEKMSGLLEAKVFAPQGVQAGLSDVSIRLEDGKLLFDPRYVKDSDAHMTPANMYIRGRRR